MSQKKAFENIVPYGDFPLYPQHFLAFQGQFSDFESKLRCRLQTLSIWTSLTCNRFPNKPWFYVFAVQVFWKHCGEKMLEMSNCFFTHIVFYPFEELSTIFIKFEIVVCKLFQFGPVDLLRVELRDYC